jgi:sugar fermentation stimulation protein A
LKIDPALQEGLLERRYKRFLADVTTSENQSLTLHCPNTGSMKNCQLPGSRIWYSTSANPKRKYRHTWEIVEVTDKQLVGINTARANSLVREAITCGVIKELAGYNSIRAEVPYGRPKVPNGKPGSRIDFLLENNINSQKASCYLEVKNVSLGVGNSLALFPDAVTTRGHKHLQELIDVYKAGHRAVLCFCVQHTGVERLQPADEIDPEYGRLLRLANNAGVELIAYGANIDTKTSVIELTRELAVELPV